MTRIKIISLVLFMLLPGIALQRAFAQAQPIVLTCPVLTPVIAVNKTTPIAVSFTPTTTGGVEPITITSAPASGSLFPFGPTTVMVGARDAENHVTGCTFDVIVDVVSTCPLAVTGVSWPAGNSGSRSIKFSASRPWVGFAVRWREPILGTVGQILPTSLLVWDAVPPDYCTTLIQR